MFRGLELSFGDFIKKIRYSTFLSVHHHHAKPKKDKVSWDWTRNSCEADGQQSPSAMC